jgi:hypothetical protein
LTIVGSGTILIIIGLIITGTGSIWLIARRRRIRERTEVSSSEVSMEMMSNRQEEEDCKLLSLLIDALSPNIFDKCCIKGETIVVV